MTYLSSIILFVTLLSSASGKTGCSWNSVDSTCNVAFGTCSDYTTWNTCAMVKPKTQNSCEALSADCVWKIKPTDKKLEECTSGFKYCDSIGCCTSDIIGTYCKNKHPTATQTCGIVGNDRKYCFVTNISECEFAACYGQMLCNSDRNGNIISSQSDCYTQDAYVLGGYDSSYNSWNNLNCNNSSLKSSEIVLSAIIATIMTGIVMCVN